MTMSWQQGRGADKLKSLASHIVPGTSSTNSTRDYDGDVSLTGLDISSPSDVDTRTRDRKSARPMTSSSRDSIISAASGAYYSAQEDDDDEEDGDVGATFGSDQDDTDTDAKRSFLPGLSSSSSSDRRCDPPSTPIGLSSPSSSSAAWARAPPAPSAPAPAPALAPAAPRTPRTPRAAPPPPSPGGTTPSSNSAPAENASTPTNKRTQTDVPTYPSSPPSTSYPSTWEQQDPTRTPTSNANAAFSPVLASSSASRKSAKSSKSKRRQKVESPPSPIIAPRRGSLVRSAADTTPSTPSSPFPPAGSASSHPYSFHGGAGGSDADFHHSRQPMHSGDLSAVPPSPGLALGSPTGRKHPSHSSSSSVSSNTQRQSAPRFSADITNGSRVHPAQVPSTPTSPTSPTSPTGAGLGVRLATGSQDIAMARASQTITEEDHGSLERSLLQRWILSFGTVNFDLEKGPDLETLWPPLSISKEEKDNIAFSSFPDTSIFDEGDTHFSFRIREVPLDASISSPPRIGSSASTGAFPSHPPPAPSSSANNSGRPSQTVPTRKGRELSSSSNASVRSLFSRAGAGGNSSTDRNSQLDAAATAELQKAAASQGWEPDGADSDASSRSSVDVTSHKPNDDDREVLHDSNDAAATATAATLPRSASFNTIAAGRGIAGGGGGQKAVSSSSSSSYIYGYSFFRQRRDSSIRRGYFQKSLVILSHLPYVSLFSEIVSKLGPLYFDHGEPILEAFASTVTKWPNPSPGATLPLPLFGSVLWAALPLGRQGQSSAGGGGDANKTAAATSLAKKSSAHKLAQVIKCKEVGTSEEEPVLASIPSTPLVEVFKEALADMWLIWECVLLAEPIMVIAPDPKIASEAVWHLMDICRPIPHAGDFRPFFTIHDYDFKQLAGRNHPPAGTIIGCTNPFMAQTCAGFQNVLRVGKAAAKLGTAGKYGSKGSGTGNRGSAGPAGGGIAGGQGAGGGGPQHIPGFTTKRKRRISKDRPLLKTLLEQVEQQESIPVANAMLRRHLADMTERFLAPLNRYVSSLIPPGGVSDPSKIKPFNTDAFLASLKTHGTPLAIRSRSLPTASTVRQGLYLDFLKSPNFSYYLTERIAYYKTRDPVPTSKKSRFES